MNAVAAPAAGIASAARRVLRALASLKLTLAGLVLLGGAALVAGYTELPAAWPLAAPLLLLTANLAAAIAVNPVFRRDGALLAFHVALLAVVALAAAGRLTDLKGRLELTTGETFEGVLAEVHAGPLHAGGLARVRFTNAGFEIAYSPGRNRDETRNTVHWRLDGREGEAVIGDQQPLELAGYRFLPTANKGFAPLLAWRAPDGSVHRGTVHLPSFPLHEANQVQDWRPPGSTRSVWMMLEYDGVLVDPARHARFEVPQRHRLVVRAGGERHVLEPGGAAAVAGGVLAYEALRTWMGYEVSYDWTLPWMLAAALVAVAALGAYFWRRFSREAWDA